jgi:hypothetical protein
MAWKLVMATKQIAIQRFRVTSSKSFEEVLTAVDGSIPFSSTKKITDEIFFGKDRLRDVEEMIMQSK